MRFIIDRFEGNFAIVEIDEEMLEIPREIIPLDAREGDVISVSIDKNETEERQKRIQNKFNGLLSD